MEPLDIAMLGTVLMTDIEGSVTLWDVDPSAMALAVAAHNSLIDQLVTAHGGHFVKARGEGDSTFSVFGEATSAIAAATAVHDRLLSVAWPTRERPRVRIALTTGTVEDRDEELVGAVPNRCARLRALIAGDQIVVSGSTVDASNEVVPDGWTLTSIGHKVLRGLSRPEPAFLLRPTRTMGEVAMSAVPSDLSWISLPSAPFVGRAAELATFSAAVAEATESGHGTTVLVCGEPGIGKTRLLAELAKQADALDALVLYGHCDEHAVVPFQPFVEALNHVVAVDPYQLTAGELSADLAVLFPQISTRVAAVAPAGLDPETQRFRMFDAVDRALSYLASARPIVLIADDLHWADHSTLLLLRHLARSTVSRRLLLVAAFRDTDLAGSQLGEELVLLRRHGGTVDVPLGGLTSGEIGSLLEEQAGHPIGPQGNALAERLHRETAGNSLFVQQVLRELVESGRLVLRDGVWTVTEEIDQFGIPETLAAVVRARTGRLSSAAQALLACASVVGSEFDLSVVAEVAGYDEDAALQALEETLANRLVVELPSAERLTFAHAVVRRTLYDALSSPRRARLHLAIARALEARAEDGQEVAVDELARHFGSAGPRGSRGAVRYERMAGERALRALAFDVAADHFRRALAAVGTGDSIERAELLLALADAQNRFGDIEQAKPALLEAAELARQLHRKDLAARAALAYGGELPAASPLDLPAVTLLRDTLTMLDPEPCVERALVTGRLAQEEYWITPRAARDEKCQQAVAMARELGDERTLATVLLNHYWALDGPDGLHDRLAIGAEVERLGRQLGDLLLVAQGAKCRLHALLGLADQQAFDVAEELRVLAEEMRQPEYLRLAMGFDAARAGSAGRYDEAERLASQARSILQARGLRIHASIAHALQLLPWRWFQCRLDERLSYHRQLVAFEPLRPTWLASLGWIEAETGGLDAAEDHLTALDLEHYLQQDPTMDWWPVTVGAAHTAIALERDDVAALLYRALSPYRGRNASVGQILFFGAVDHHLGDLATMQGRYDEAVSHHEVALERHRMMGATAYVALSEVALAEALLARGNGDDHRAPALAAAGMQLADQLGLTRVLKRAERFSAPAAPLVARGDRDGGG